MKKAMKNFVEAEKAYFEAKKELQRILSENMPNPFMKIDFTAVRKEVKKIEKVEKEKVTIH